MNFALKSVRIAAFAMLLSFSTMAAFAAVRAQNANPHIGMVDAVASACFAAAAVWSFIRGPIALVQAASAMTCVYALAYLMTRSDLAASDWTNAAVYRALAIEGVLIWAVLLAAGVFVLRGKRQSGHTA